MIDNFDVLVERCTARRRRHMIRRSLIIAAAVLFAVASIAAYMTWFASPTLPEVTQKPVLKRQQPEPLTPLSAPVTESNMSAKPLPQKPIILAVSMPAAQPIPIKKSVPAPVNNAKIVAEKPVLIPTPIPSSSRNSRLFDVNTEPKALDPLSAFNNSPKYETALAIARDFYGKNNFSDAAIWAKKANQMNREGEEAWMLYAKSYYAQGRKDEAINVLELYMNYKDSKAASELLRTWKQTSAN